ncbi:XTP/dITP diphosphatase [Bacillaceae bacterium W0354]
MKPFYVATTNKGKLKEFQDIFKELNIELKSLFDDYPDAEDVEETGTTFSENAVLKAETYSRQYGINVLADDSGLEVDALNGEPGVYSARYAGEEKSDQKNLEKVLAKLENIPMEQRTGAFVCDIAFAQPGKETIVVEGRSEGILAAEPKGTSGFGYDPIFIPSGYNQTLAELGSEIKNKISHRRRALDQIVEKIRETL